MSTMTHHGELVPSHVGHLVAATVSPSGVTLHSAPRWLALAMDWTAELPAAVTTPDWAPFPSMIRDLAENHLPIRDLVLELQTPSREMLFVLVQGRWEEDLAAAVPGAPAGEGALLLVRDISDVMRERRRMAAIGTFHGLIGRSLPMLEVYQKIATYGPTEAPIIITGETGTGKELIARAIHERSPRQDGPFVAVNCVALTAELFESELFGHEKGSFTGALKQHKGRFQRADTGTLFLDEIGDMPLMTQAKMLRALEEGVIERVGGEREEKVDVRVVAATNVALEQAVQLRRFRIDLFHRLSVLRIHIPALRDRTGDLPLLVEHYLGTFNRRYSKQIQRFTPEALKILEEYHWPGNIRELRNVIERLVIETAGDAVTARHLGAWIEERDYMQPGQWNADTLFDARQPIIAPAPPMSAADHFAQDFASQPRHGDKWWGNRPTAAPAPSQLAWDQREVIEAPIIGRSLPPPEEQEAVELTAGSIREAYRAENGNVTGAARRLGVHKATLYRHMKRLGIEREDLERLGEG
ncbi:AAA family ATPase [bacterium]|nr:AAA family ATPase [bacterium]